ncbi:MAG TPA: dihydroorotase [Clostridiales bacterium]|nr:dihydroorotase [Clostridiales bacterium]
MSILIKNGYVINGNGVNNGIKDIFIDNGLIAEINEDLHMKADTVIDATGLHVFPGFVDAHCHLRDPGFEYKEDIKSGTRSAAQGGFTSVACMPNTDPVADNKAVISYIINKAKHEGVVNVFPIGAVTKNQKGEFLADIGEMKQAGAVALSDDGRPVLSASLMRKAVQYASAFDLTVISHCEDLSLVEHGSMNEGYMSTVLGLPGIPHEAEEVMVAREILLSEGLNIPIHIAHVSTKTSVALIRDAKRRGVKITCETCPHYFSLTDEAVTGYDTNAKVNPPLRTEEGRIAIIQGLADDTIDIIATDHAPHHQDEKNVEFNLAANGISGFETAFGLCSTYLLKPGVLTLERFVDKIAVNPSRLLKIKRGTLKRGDAADVTICDLERPVQVDVKKFYSKGKNSPYDGKSLIGTVEYTIVSGKPIVMKQEPVTPEEGV